MNDKTLLELAAKAAGIEIELCHFGSSKSFFIVEDGRLIEQWNPLKHDGDALRLAVKLNLSIAIFVGYTPNCNDCNQVREELNGDPYAATRRAIVRAAAEKGRGME